MLIVVRHGTTKLNGTGSDEKMRGWLKLPLSNEGRDQVNHTAHLLKSLNLKGTIDTAYTSDLPRAIETAKKLQPAIGIDIKPTKQLRDWDVGDYTGKSVKDNLSEIHSYIDNPESKIPGGESFGDFYHRTGPFVKKLVEDDKTHLAITHNRITTLLDAMSKTKGNDPDIKTLKGKGPVDPAGLMFIDSDWNILNKINI